ncbi:MAG TPA: helix-turn-helix domain-containing protein [Kofleriaceae bacterium]|nr:helix-turn-helix domain-containing protein [Kofleriaceae bacterium]
MADDKLDTKQRILAAAEAEFLVHGYEGSRMQAIADRAGLNKAMLHYHFRSKDDLFAHVFQDKAKLLFPKVQASFRAHTDFIEFTCAFVDLYMAHLMAHPFLPLYLLQVSATNAALFKQVVTDFPLRFIAAFRAAIRAGTVRAHDPVQLMISVLGMCVMPFAARHMIQHLLELDDAAFQSLMKRRAAEVKRYVVLLLTPETGRAEVR